MLRKVGRLASEEELMLGAGLCFSVGVYNHIVIYLYNLYYSSVNLGLLYDSHPSAVLGVCCILPGPLSRLLSGSGGPMTGGSDRYHTRYWESEITIKVD